MKKIIIIVGALVFVFLVMAFMGPAEIKVERNADIKAPKALIYKNITDYNNWMKWSPWAAYDSAAKYEYFGTQGQVGAGFKWEGNSKVGKGEMKTMELEENSKVVSQLTMSGATPLATFKLDDAGNGSTKVSWGFHNNIPFYMRPAMLLMNMDRMLGGDYERGLANLKAVCEKEAEGGGTAQAMLEVKETEWPGKVYIAKRMEVSMAEVGKTFQDNMPKTYSYVGENKMEMQGAPSGLYFTWDTVKKTSDMAVAIPVKDAKKVSGDYKTITLDKSKAVVVDYYGPYEKISSAHEAIGKYLSDKGIKQKSPVIEEYVTDPGTEKDPAKWLTKVYYLID